MNNFFKDNKTLIFIKDKKMEISNICFLSYYKKKKYLHQQIYKRKISEIFLQKTQKNFLRWDIERKLFYGKINEEKGDYLVKIGPDIYFYPEIIFFSKNLKFNFYYRNNFLTNIEIDSEFSKKFKFSSILIHFYLETWGFLVFRFGLLHINLINPLFICFPRRRERTIATSIFNLNDYHSFSFPLSLTILAIRLKPGLLKLVINGTFGILSFTLNIGFSSFCPIFISQRIEKFYKTLNKRKRKTKNLIFFFDQ